jgi:hypothetical protein
MKYIESWYYGAMALVVGITLAIGTCASNRVDTFETADMAAPAAENTGQGMSVDPG